MRLGESLAAQAASGQRPWADQDRACTAAERGEAAQAGKYGSHSVAARELRTALSDGEWHPRRVATLIAERHGIGVQGLIDRSGVYGEGGWILLARAAK
ncbi:MAG: hypothetical protein WD492_12685 [Alkalispirochaeta sp.]